MSSLHFMRTAAITAPPSDPPPQPARTALTAPSGGPGPAIPSHSPGDVRAVSLLAVAPVVFVRDTRGVAVSSSRG
jgi:hypothetical protein